jgi:hypothetical protein
MKIAKPALTYGEANKHVCFHAAKKDWKVRTNVLLEQWPT